MDINQAHHQTAEVLKLIAHPLRLRILLTLLEQPALQVSALQEQLKIEQALLSVYLNKMKDRGLLVGRRQGTSIYYTLRNPAFVDQLKQILERSAL
ncbi:ArsR/SmtB family transcription factor [Spirosoma sp.]|uniref:ArsR/SmtB family transcription factor n=1 Tax=Spirosoma sp. TaxID=1899569 RepID=UPI003B3B0D82